MKEYGETFNGRNHSSGLNIVNPLPPIKWAESYWIQAKVVEHLE